MIAKETSKSAVETKTGTYTCTTGCGSHPELGKGGIQTFNTMLTDTGNNESDIQIQATLNLRTYGPGNLKQSNCVTGTGVFGTTNCDITGSFQANSGPVQVTGSHVYFGGASPDCSTITGNFVYTSTLFGESGMSFETDSSGECF